VTRHTSHVTPAGASREVNETVEMARNREAAIVSEGSTRGLTPFEHSLMSLAGDV